MLDRLRRGTDLFVEGDALFLGMDDGHKPVLIWVNKLNSFEAEEARRDGLARRGERVLQLSKPDNPERLALQASLDLWSMQQLAEARANQQAEEIYLNVVNDIEADPEWAEKIALIRRLPSLLEDQQVPDDDQRRKDLDEIRTGYLNQLRVRQEQAQQQRLNELLEVDRETLQKEFFEGWMNRASLDAYMEEKQVTELFYAMRDCVATEKGREETTGKILWDHSDCNHSSRLCNERSDVRSLPEQIIEKVIEALENITVPLRDSGNSDAPASSSASSEQPSKEEASTASIPEEISPAALTTSAPQ